MQIRDEVEQRGKALEDLLEKEMAQRTLWIRKDAEDKAGELVQRLREEVERREIERRREWRAALGAAEARLDTLERRLAAAAGGATTDGPGGGGSGRPPAGDGS